MIRKPNFKLNWKYALGEVLLIFIGISLAIWFQNWNEDRKTEAKEKVYLKNLLKDLNVVKNSIEFELFTAENKIASGTELLEFLEKGEPIDSLNFLISSYHISLFTPHQYYLPTFDDLKSSGNTAIIKNPDILLRVGNYAYRVSLFEDMVYAPARAAKNRFHERIINYADPRTAKFLWRRALKEKSTPDESEITNLRVNLNEIQQDKLLQTYLLDAIASEEILIEWYSALIEENVLPCIDLINEELKL